MPSFDLKPAEPTQPIAGLIAMGASMRELCGKLEDRRDLMVVTGEDWLAVFSFGSEPALPWLSCPPIYLYALGPKLLCQSGFEPDLPKPLIPALTQKLTIKGTMALSHGPKIWDLSAALPVEQCNLRALA